MNVATNTTAEPDGATPSLYRLIADYWDRYDLLNEAMRAADAAEDGDPEKSARAEAAQSEASDKLDEAGIAVCAYVPTWIVEAKVKHSFVTGIMDREGGRLDTDQLDALVSSMSDLYQPRRQAERYEAPLRQAPDVDRDADADLSAMLSEHERLTAAINRHDGPAEDTDVNALCKQQRENALAICGYRPVTKAAERRKGEFLRSWTESTYLTEEEQSALIASLTAGGDRHG